jgi:hypothetical protein
MSSSLESTIRGHGSQEYRGMNYWAKILDGRVARRRALALFGGAVLGAELLAACGGDEASGPVDKSALLSKPADTTKDAKRGGILRRSNSSLPPFITLTGRAADPLLRARVS